MTDLVRLGLVVDSNGFVRAKRDMDSFKKSSSDVTKQTDDMGKTMSSTNNIAAAFGKTLGLIGATLLTTGFVKYTNTWTDLNSRLINATGSAEDARIALEAISETARRTYSSLEATAQGFLQNNLVLKELGYSTRQQLDMMSALNNSLVISGAKGQEAELVMGAFGRAMAQGKLAGQELNLIMNYSSRTVEALAEGLGVTTIELRKMTAAGQVTADKMFGALVSQMQKLEDESGAMPATIGDAFLLIRNAVLETIGVFDQQNQISGRLAESLVWVADNLRDMIAVLGGAAAGFVAYQLAVNGTSLALTAATAAQRLFNTAALANPYVAIAAAIVGVGVALYGLRDRIVEIGDTTAAIGDYAKAVWGEVAAAGAGAATATATAWQEFRAFSGPLVDGIFENYKWMWGQVFSIGRDTVNAIIGLFVTIGQSAGIAVTSIYEDFKAGFGSILQIGRAFGQDLAAIFSGEFSFGNFKQAIAGELVEPGVSAASEIRAAWGANMGRDWLGDAVEGVSNFVERISDVAGESYQARKALEKTEGAMVSVGEASDDSADAIASVTHALDAYFKMESKRSTATAGIITNIDALAREYNALLAGTEAHKAVTRELAIEAAMREAVAQGIIQEAGPAYRQLIETQYDLANAVSEFKGQADPFAESWQAALERVDSAFVDLWKSAFTGFKGFAETLKNAFIQLLAELAHRATTQKIMVSLGLGDAGVGGDILGKIPGFSSLTKNTGIDDILKGLGKGEGGFDKTALLDGFKQMGLTIAASWTGGKIGTAIGEGLFNKQAESNIGQTIGSTIGAIWGPWGALAGSTLGSLVDTMTGGDGYKRQNAGLLIGNTPGAKPEYTFDVEDFASGLKVTGFARREDEQVARQVIEGFRDLDAMVVQAGQALGGFVDQLKITGLNEEATSGSLGTFLGLGRDADLPAQMKAYVDQLISSFGGLDQSIIDLVKNASTAEDAIRVLGDATRLMQIQQVASGMNAVEQAREQFNAQTSLTSVYQAATDQLRQLSMGYTGTIEQTAQLADAMVYQQEATYNLALAYMQVQSSVDSLFGNLSENIRMSLMSEQELYEYQRAQIEALSASINMMTDPEMILGTADRIESQLSQVWGRLDEEQRKAMGPEFLQFIDQTNAIAQDKLRQGLAAVEVTQEDINRTIQQGIESAATQMGLAAAVQMQAAQMQMQAASVWADAANNRRESNA